MSMIMIVVILIVAMIVCDYDSYVDDIHRMFIVIMIVHNSSH